MAFLFSFISNLCLSFHRKYSTFFLPFRRLTNRRMTQRASKAFATIWLIGRLDQNALPFRFSLFFPSKMPPRFPWPIPVAKLSPPLSNLLYFPLFVILALVLFQKICFLIHFVSLQSLSHIFHHILSL
jgi:hypothetical protein